MGPQARVWLATVSAAAAALTMAIQAVVPALPALQKALGLTTAQLGWFTIVYLVPTVVLTIPSGIVTARFGPRKVFAAALVVYAVVGTAQGLVESYEAILVLRAIQGLCFAIAMPTTIALLAEAFEDRRQLRAFSVREITLTAAQFVWPLMGTALATVSWRGPFFAQAALLPLALVFLLAPAPHEGRPRQPARAAVGMIAALRGEPVMLNVMLLAFGRYFFRFVIITFVPVLVVVEGRGSLTQAGLAVAIVAAASAVSASALDRLVANRPPAFLAIVSSLAYGIGLLGLGLAGAEWWLLVPAIVFGFGDGVLAVLSDVYAVRLWQREVRVQVLAVSQTFRNLGKLMAPVMMSLLVLVVDAQTAFLIAAALTLPFVAGLVPLRAVDQRVGHAPEV